MLSISLYRTPNCGVNLGSVLLHAGQDVAMEVEGNPDARMAEAFLRHLGVDANNDPIGRTLGSVRTVSGRAALLDAPACVAK